MDPTTTDTTTETTVCTERRRHERLACVKPCKVLHSASMRFMAARTLDLSPGGALVELSRHRPLRRGDRVDVLVDWDERGVVGRETTLEAMIVRADDADGPSQRVAIAFLTDQALPVAA